MKASLFALPEVMLDQLVATQASNLWEDWPQTSNASYLYGQATQDSCPLVLCTSQAWPVPASPTTPCFTYSYSWSLISKCRHTCSQPQIHMMGYHSRTLLQTHKIPLSIKSLMYICVIDSSSFFSLESCSACRVQSNTTRPTADHWHMSGPIHIQRNQSTDSQSRCAY